VSTGGGSGVGAVLGTILGAVIRGGVVMGDGDNCDPRTEGGHTSVNRQIPRFPVSIPRPGGRINRSGGVGSIPIGRIPRF
jgi:hypothetical protein